MRNTILIYGFCYINRIICEGVFGALPIIFLVSPYSPMVECELDTSNQTIPLNLTDGASIIFIRLAIYISIYIYIYIYREIMKVMNLTGKDYELKCLEW